LATILALPIRAQKIEPELKMRILNEMPDINDTVAIVFFYSNSENIPTKPDSIDRVGRKIIRYQGVEFFVDTILDTVMIQSKYLDYERQILNAYRWLGKPQYIVNNFDSSETVLHNWLIWEKRVSQRDTIKFLRKGHNIQIGRNTSRSNNEEKLIWTSVAWIFFFMGLVIWFLSDIDKFKNKIKKSLWFQIFTFIVIVCALASVIIICIGSETWTWLIFIVIILIVIFYARLIIRCYKK